MSIAPHVNQTARNLILDYALGGAIAVLLPLPGAQWLKFLVLGFLHYKLLRGLLRLWRGHRGGDGLAVVAAVMGWAGAVLLGLMAWLSILSVSIFLPWMRPLAGGVGIFWYFWGMGQTIHHFFLSGEVPLRADLSPGSVPPGGHDEG